MDGQLPITPGTPGGMSLGTPAGTAPGTMVGIALGAMVGTVPYISVIGIALTTVGGAITGMITGDGDTTIITGAGHTELTMTGLLIVLTDPILT